MTTVHAFFEGKPRTVNVTPHQACKRGSREIALRIESPGRVAPLAVAYIEEAEAVRLANAILKMAMESAFDCMFEPKVEA